MLRKQRSRFDSGEGKANLGLLSNDDGRMGFGGLNQPAQKNPYREITPSIRPNNIPITQRGAA